jgi:cation:H+ antiporter
MIITDLILVAVGLVGLFFGGDWLVKGAARLATALGVSSLVVGLTVVAVGTSLPELLVSISAALQGTNGIVLGNVLGSNIANIGLILGVTALILPIGVHWKLLIREIPIMIAASVLALLLALDGSLSLVDGVVLMIGFGVFSLILLRTGVSEEAEIAPELSEFEAEQGITAKTTIPVEVGRVVVGLVLLIVGAQFLIQGAVGIARAAGISELLIGLTLVAVGTSLPELATSVIAAIRKESDIAIGNVIGSNIANLFIILGLTAVIRPVPVAETILRTEYLVMIGFAVAVFPLALSRTIGRKEGALLLIAYTVFVVASFLTNGAPVAVAAP